MVKITRPARSILICRNCQSNNVGDNLRGSYVCFSCGRIHTDMVFEGEPDWWQFSPKTYKRIFYFNERCSRWACKEPFIEKGVWKVIRNTMDKISGIKNKLIKAWESNVEGSTRKYVSKILRSVKLTEKQKLKWQSKKFKKTLMSEKRFYDKYFEKWKTISWRITQKRPELPDPLLVEKIKDLFVGCQAPFDIYRHNERCDGRSGCDKYFGCWHNFLNYDFTIRKLLQIAEIKFGFIGCYDLHKKEFPLVSKKIRDEKLRPLFFKICLYNKWPCPSNE